MHAQFTRLIDRSGVSIGNTSEIEILDKSRSLFELRGIVKDKDQVSHIEFSDVHLCVTEASSTILDGEFHVQNTEFPQATRNKYTTSNNLVKIQLNPVDESPEMCEILKKEEFYR